MSEITRRLARNLMDQARQGPPPDNKLAKALIQGEYYKGHDPVEYMRQTPLMQSLYDQQLVSWLKGAKSAPEMPWNADDNLSVKDTAKLWGGLVAQMLADPVKAYEESVTGQVPMEEGARRSAFGVAGLGGAFGAASAPVGSLAMGGAIHPKALGLLAKEGKRGVINPKTAAKTLRREGVFDGPSSDIAEEFDNIMLKQQQRSNNKPYNPSLDPLELSRRWRSSRLDDIRRERKADSIIGPLWNNKFAEDVRRGVMGGYGASQAINRANMEAAPRILKKEGWTMRHASKGNSGRMSSRYLVSPNGDFEIRISDHELPETLQRMYARENYGGPRWNDEIILQGNESPAEVIALIKKAYLDSFE